MSNATVHATSSKASGRSLFAERRVPCTFGCGRDGEGPHFVADVRMRGVLIRVEVEGEPWFVCGPCLKRWGRPQPCLRCGYDTHVVLPSAVRCARCGELG
jgi:hypothetical protein